MDVNYNTSTNHTNATLFSRKLPWFFVALMIFIIAASVFGNSLVLIATWKNKRLRNQGRCFLASLAVADILVGMFTTPCRLYQSIASQPLSPQFCSAYFWLVTLANGVSITTLAAVSVDRYCKIFYPLQYMAKMPTRSYTVINTVIWFSFAIYGIFVVIPYDETAIYYSAVDGCQLPKKTLKTVSVFFAFVLPAIVMCITYFLIFLKAYKRRRSNIVANQDHCMFKKDLRNIVTLAVIVLAYFLFLGPYFVAQFLRIPDCRNLNNTCYAIVVVLPRFNSCCNPVIYACFDKEYRDAFKKLFRKHKNTSAKMTTRSCERPHRSSAFITST